MKNKLSAVLLLLTALLLSGFAEPWTGRKRILSFLSSSLEAPQVAVAVATGNAGGCDWSTYHSTLNLRWLPDAIEQIKHASRLKQKTSDGLQEWETPYGSFWTKQGSDPFWVLGEQVVDVYETQEHQVHPGDIVLDAGANVGVFTRKALDRGAKLVVAIEPVPDSVSGLRKTFEKEIASGRVIVLAKGVWHEEGSLTMNLFDSSALDSFVMEDRVEEKAKRQVQLPLTTVDHLVADLKLERVDFIKMDIEGAERNALRGAAETIRRFQPRMSIATENLEDDYQVLPQVIQNIASGYSKSCGAGRMVSALSMRPDILFFRPSAASAQLAR